MTVVGIEGSRIELLRRTLMVYTVIFVLWGVYRLLFRFPPVVEEVVFKPLVFFPPIFSVLAGEGKGWRAALMTLGLGKKGWFLSLYYGLTLGVVYFLTVRLGSLAASGAGLNFVFSVSPTQFAAVVFLSVVTAMWEQLVFSGFLLMRLMSVFHEEWLSVSLTAFFFTLLHLPILWLEVGYSMLFVLVQLLVLFLVGFGNAVLMLRTRNVLAPILSHAFWAMAVALFV